MLMTTHKHSCKAPNALYDKGSLTEEEVLVLVIIGHVLQFLYAILQRERVGGRKTHGDAFITQDDF